MFLKPMLCVSSGGDGRKEQDLTVRRWTIHGPSGNDDAPNNRYLR